MFDALPGLGRRLARAVTDGIGVLRRRLAALDDTDGSEDVADGALAVLALAFDGLLYAAGRYAPEYLQQLDASPVVIGLFGSAGVALVLASTYLARRRPSTWVVAGAGGLGLASWALAGTLDGALGVPAVGWLFVGLLPVGAWLGYAPPRARVGPEASPFTRHVASRLDTSATAAIGAVAFATVLLLAATPVAALRTLMALGAALGASVAVAALVAGPLDRSGRSPDAPAPGGEADDRPLDRPDRDEGPALDAPSDLDLVSGNDAGPDEVELSPATDSPAGSDSPPASGARDARDTRDALDATETDVPQRYRPDVDAPETPGPEAVELDARPPAGDGVPAAASVDERDSLPANARPLVLADALVHVGLAIVSVFVVVTVTTLLAPSLAVLGLSLTPGVAFGVLLAIELGVGAAARRVGGSLADSVGPRPLVLWAFAVSAVFPLLLVAVPTGPLAFAGLFALFGTRFVAVDARRRLLADALGSEGVVLPRSVRVARDVPIALAPVVGGLLYAVGPVLAFGVASMLATLGLRELLRYRRR